MSKSKENVMQDDTPFNMAMLYYVALHQLRLLKIKLVLSNDLFGYFDCLEEIFRTISFKLTEEEEKEVTEFFTEASAKLNSQFEGYVGEQVLQIEFRNAKQILKKVDVKLIKLMHKYKMIFPGIEARGLKEIQKRFGLNG